MIFYQLYRILSLIATPLAKLHIETRIESGKEDKKRYKEKFAITDAIRPKGKLIWFHAASVGELNSIIPLIKALSQKNSKLSFLVTTVTLTSAKIFETASLPRTIHQFLPIDTPWIVSKFLKHWQPDTSIFVESELWPNLLNQASKNSKLILLNARLSDRSFKRWKLIPSFAKFMYRKFDLILASTKDDKKKISSFTKKIDFQGNLKHAAPSLIADKKKLNSLKTQIGNRKFWLAASTHSGEEEIILTAHKKLKAKYDDLLTIIIPRHATRGGTIKTLVDNSKMKAALRSKKQKITKATDIYIADTMGEIGIFYHLADIVFMGGSLIKHGGQNTLEPARLNSALITGLHTFNFKDITEDFLNADAIQVATDTTTLATSVDTLLNNKKLIREYSKNALAVTKKTDKIMDNIIKALKPYL